MAGYEIGISGLHVAQKALDIIGNNIANAATEGYHRQEIDLRPADEVYTNGQMVGQGVESAGVRRLVDQILESELLRQNSSIADIEKRLKTLRMIENAFGELSSEGLSTALDNFFASFNNLSLQPDDVNRQSSLLSSAEILANHFNSFGTVISNIEDAVYSEAVSTVERINLLATQIARMNTEVYTQEMRGNDANNTMDQRDMLIAELSELIGIRTVVRDTGMVDIAASDISLVSGSTATKLEAGFVLNQQQYQLGLRPKETQSYDTSISGGVLGGLFKLRNELVDGIKTQLDSLAQTLISQTNQLHAQGVGTNGSFTMLSGWTMIETDVAQMQPPVTDGQIRIRVIDPTGQVVRHTVSVTASSTMSSIAADIVAIPGLDQNTGVNSGRLQIIANSGYSFDFLGGTLSVPNMTVPDPLAGAGAGPSQLPPAIEVSGGYTGTVDETYTCTVKTTPPGQTNAIGTGTMELEIQNAAGAVLKTVNIGQGYVAGTSFILDNGVKIRLEANGVSPGYLSDAEQFTIEALANSDTSGFLAAVGINSFFSGTDADSIAVSDFVRDNGSNIAVSKTVEMTDNLNAGAIAALGDSAQDALGKLSPKEFYRKLVIDLGNEVSVTEMQHNNAQSIHRSLEQQRDEISGVDINDQASLMMLYERMFQAMARYMNTINETYKTVLTIIR
ncbi:MAG: flagellar hook-associated protein FlgK [Planctomycetales bacterium 4572_13]|nr:MAG: flagellar hook-associated protein FlgK [Planctomycetales bacterium 4572_13]